MKVFLSVYVVVAVLFVFVLRSWLHRRRTGASAFVERFGDDLLGYVGRMMFVAVGLFGASVALYATGGEIYERVVPIAPLDRVEIHIAAVALLVGALAWIAVAQLQMGSSWRIGVDPGARTSLVTRGLFARSRNPIFLGMRGMAAGIFLASPNLLSLAAAVLSEVLIQVQVRAEESYLERTHGDEYRKYRAAVPRWLSWSPGHWKIDRYGERLTKAALDRLR